jgi:hypothetical protein
MILLIWTVVAVVGFAALIVQIRFHMMTLLVNMSMFIAGQDTLDQLQLIFPANILLAVNVLVLFYMEINQKNIVGRRGFEGAGFC